jgi:predicted nucleic acid-binding protein
VLSLLCHPDTSLTEVQEINAWLERHLSAGAAVYVPEITDYEVRRELLRARKLRSIRKLDSPAIRLTYLPLDTPTMRRAAEMWAEARQRGVPTADPKEIDADVILPAPAERASAIVPTKKVGHLGRFVAAQHRRLIH